MRIDELLADLLFEIDPRPYQTALDKAEAQQAAAEAALKLANAELARARQLMTKGAASREELDVKAGNQAVAAAEVRKARAAVEEAKLDLGYTKIRATSRWTAAKSRTKTSPSPTCSIPCKSTSARITSTT